MRVGEMRVGKMSPIRSIRKSEESTPIKGLGVKKAQKPGKFEEPLVPEDHKNPTNNRKPYKNLKNQNI